MTDIKKMPTNCPLCAGTGKFQGDTGSKLVWLRKEKNLTQEQVALDIGVSRPALANMELNRQNITAQTLIVIARYFKISIDWLLNVDKSP